MQVLFVDTPGLRHIAFGTIRGGKTLVCMSVNSVGRDRPTPNEMCKGVPLPRAEAAPCVMESQLSLSQEAKNFFECLRRKTSNRAQCGLCGLERISLASNLSAVIPGVCTDLWFNRDLWLRNDGG